MLAAVLAALVLAGAGVAPRTGDYVGSALTVHVRHGRVTAIGGPAATAAR